VIDHACSSGVVGHLAGLLAQLCLAFYAPGPLAAGPVPGQPGIIGEDQRVPKDDRGYPWSAIGRLNSTLGPFCTGTLIAANTVLTAAHCLWNRRTDRWLPPFALHFLAGYQRSDYVAHSRVASYRVGVHADAADLPGPPDLVGDWALLTLEDDLSAAVRPLPVAPHSARLMLDYGQRGGTYLQAGYSRDRAHLLTIHDPCRLRGFSANGALLFHECDATFGDSGSPILLHMQGEYHVIAVHVAADNSGLRGIAVASAVFIESARSALNGRPKQGRTDACMTRDECKVVP
jgi:protease YdgD